MSDAAPRPETRLSFLCVPDGSLEEKCRRLLLVPCVPVMVIFLCHSSFRVMTGRRAGQATTEVAFLSAVGVSSPVGTGACFFVWELASSSGCLLITSKSSITYDIIEGEVIGSCSRCLMSHGEKYLSNVASHEAFIDVYDHPGTWR